MADPLVSQLVAETLSHAAPPDARAGQLVVETLSSLAVVVSPSPIRVSQSPVELLNQESAGAFVSQSPVETVQQFNPSSVAARVSQAPLEIIYPFGCYTYVPPPLPRVGCPITPDWPID